MLERTRGSTPPTPAAPPAPARPTHARPPARPRPAPPAPARPRPPRPPCISHAHALAPDPRPRPLTRPRRTFCASGPDTLESYGIRDCLRKPVCVSSLRHILHKWLPRLHVADVTSTFSTLGISSTSNTAGFARGGSGSFRARVLLVDDCHVTLTATCYLFQELGLWVDTAPSGEAAMDLIKSTRDFDLLLLDVHLPCMSGYALCSWYKSFCHDAGRVPARVVAVTSDPDIETCASFGVDRCLPKPLTVNNAELVLAEWLSHRALELEVNQLEHREDSLDTAHYVKRPTPSHDNLPVPYVDAARHIRPTLTTSSALG